MEEHEDDEPLRPAPPPEDNSVGRLLALSDGVFAIGMTLLAVPDLPAGADQQALPGALRGEIPSILTYLLSFYAVANHWIAHHALMRSVTRTHPRLIWLRHDLVAYDLSTAAAADPDGWRRSGLALRGNLVVFVLCLPAALLLGILRPGGGPARRRTRR
jgi:hypothetical protein